MKFDHAAGDSLRSALKKCFAAVVVVAMGSVSIAQAGPSCSKVFSSLSAQEVLEGISWITELKQFGTVKLENLTPYGDHPDFLYLSKISGVEVIAKSLAPRFNRPSYPIEEVYFMKLLSDLGIGPKFFGVSEVKGEPVVVSQVIKGEIYHNLGDWPYKRWGMKRKADTVKQAALGLQELANLGVVAGDFQFFIDSNGKVYIFDTDYYFFQPVPQANKVNLRHLTKLMIDTKIISVHEERNIVSFDQAFAVIESYSK
ncbi:hypothetical protein [Bdellovibrio sp. KM01]|uniref:hypothetical protein n=1 Tax=Bdellovibrio sp. KM01 TaxID=2748865 RepID=UPI0015EAAD7D|nr:hypothetical protein [Bdellovibrio sp. KM01]QLY24275.1 hypothetical protein HW988_12460 [Bdellovibrio sp. KM01]